MIYIIIGTKGQFLKMFPVMKMMDKEHIPYKFIHTCQHYGIIEENRKRLGVRKPDIFLTMKKKDLANIWEFIAWAPQVIWNARKLSIKKGDYVINHGDAESTLLTFIIGKLSGATNVHIEAGLRSYNLLEPFPEEITRIIVSRFSEICFCPYQKDADTLRGKKNVFITKGNTVYDSVRDALTFQPSQKIISLFNKRYALFLIHRKENLFFEKRLQILLNVLEMMLQRKITVIWPIHANTLYELKKRTSVWSKITELKLKYDLRDNYFLDYVDFMHAVKHAQFVASDGGGLQEETYLLNTPMLVLRKAVEKGSGLGETALLSLLEKDKIEFFLSHYAEFRRKRSVVGSPSKIIVKYFKTVL